MGSVGILLVLLGYTLMYCGLKDIPVMQEIGYGLGLDTDPFLDKAGVTAAVATKDGKGKGGKKSKKDQQAQRNRDKSTGSTGNTAETYGN